MKHIITLFFISALFFNCSLKTNTTNLYHSDSNSKKVIAYVTSIEDNWGNNFERANQITHINFAFANIKNGIVVEGSKNDIETIKKINSLKITNPNLKVLISIGGWSWSKNFSDAVLTKTSREKFGNSAVSFMQKSNIDGIDLDWEYPGLPGDNNTHRPEDKENFTAILKLIREKLDKLSSTTKKEYLLTIATGASQNYLDHTNMKEVQKYLDFINIMTYDFHGIGGITSHNAGLMHSKFDKTNASSNVQIAVEQHLKAGIPANKLVLGVPFYGRWKKGVNPTGKGAYQIAKGSSGSYNYHTIVDSLKSNVGFTEYWDESAKVPYVWREKDSLFLSYDNEKSIKYKVEFAKSKQLGGIMFWQFNGDSNGKLLKTIHDSLYK